MHANMAPFAFSRRAVPRFVLAAAVLLVLTLPAAARIPRRFIPPRYAAFVGYSSRADIVLVPLSSVPISVPNIEKLDGWHGSFERRIIPFLGVVADVRGHYGSYGATAGCGALLICVPVSGDVHSSLYTVMFGPQAEISLWRFTPFVHILFGVAHINHAAALIQLSPLADSATSFADAFGGGFDFRVVSIVHLRFQADLLETRLYGVPTPLGSILGSQYGVRGSAGVVLRF
jgi:hypothetical protein